MFKIFGIFGLVAISIGIWVKKETHQNLVFILGGISLAIYSIYIGDVIFIVLQLVFIFSALYELIKLKIKK